MVAKAITAPFLSPRLVPHTRPSSVTGLRERSPTTTRPVVRIEGIALSLRMPPAGSYLRAETGL